MAEQQEQWTANRHFIFLFSSSRTLHSCRAPRKISRSPHLAHKAPVMQARRECLRELNFTEVQVPDNTETVELKEKMGFRNGENPAVEFEDGTQKGGHFSCSGCCGDMRQASEYRYMLNQKFQSLEEKQSLVLKGKFGKSNASGPFIPSKLKTSEQN